MSDGTLDHGPNGGDAGSDAERQRQVLSSLADGHLDADGVRHACSAWRDDVVARRTWHTYHLIGDVLRSDDLALGAMRHESFLIQLRERLAVEPVVPSAQPLAELHMRAAAVGDRSVKAANGSSFFRRAWAAPMAVAAGFVAVAGVLVVTRMPPVSGTSVAPLMAAASVPVATPGAALTDASANANANEVATLGPDARLVRDVRLEGYLAAHKQFGNVAAVSVPGVMLRNAAVFVPER